MKPAYMRLVFLLSLALAFSQASLYATTYTVTRSDDRNLNCVLGDCSLREAVNAANGLSSNDVIVFAQTVSLVTLSNEIVINNNGSLTISGRGANISTVDAGLGPNRIFNSQDATLVINDISLIGGKPSNGGGGAINMTRGSLLLERVSLSGNEATLSGGAIFVDGGVHRIRHSTIASNYAGYSCGAVTNISAVLTVVNSTISNNEAANIGGGICSITLTTFGGTNLRNVTISGNRASWGGGFWLDGGVFSLGNTIISGNSALTNWQEIYFGPNASVTSLGNNFVGNSAGDSTNTVNPIPYQPSDVRDIPPMLGPLQNNGGPTSTHALLSLSPAINAGNNSLAIDPFDSSLLLTDQRGLSPRSIGGLVDIGAFEFSKVRARFDFDGDSRTDVSIFRPSVAEWWVNRSSTGITFATQFGATTDAITPGDFTGDGKTDIAFWRPSNGFWFVLRSEDFSFFSFPFGTTEDVPTVGDFDGDSLADATVYRPSSTTWFVRRSSDGGATIQQFGAAGDIPVPADYDGDGRDDIAIYRPSLGQWWLSRSTAGVIAMTFGAPSDKPVQGDFTGDSKADVAIWRPATGEWFVLRSEDFSYFSFPFGISTDIPAPGDYDGDGKFDAAVFRPSSSTWYAQRTTAGTLIQQFGSAGDRPVPGAFVP